MSDRSKLDPKGVNFRHIDDTCESCKYRESSRCVIIDAGFSVGSANGNDWSNAAARFVCDRYIEHEEVTKRRERRERVLVCAYCICSSAPGERWRVVRDQVVCPECDESGAWFSSP